MTITPNDRLLILDLIDHRLDDLCDGDQVLDPEYTDLVGELTELRSRLT